jgi:hypothetical protein
MAVKMTLMVLDKLSNLFEEGLEGGSWEVVLKIAFRIKNKISNCIILKGL